MTKLSAGLLMFRKRNRALEVLLVHPGGPYWRTKDAGAWTIPKGEPAGAENPLVTAQREFEEETGVAPEPPFIELTPVAQRGGKTVLAWAFEGDCDPTAIQSNTFQAEWPPHSGTMREYPEIDRAEFFAVEVAKDKINPAQVAFLEELRQRLSPAP
jgi:predicted NUDIX family NTP pyrophosphohydrolase